MTPPKLILLREPFPAYAYTAISTSTSCRTSSGSRSSRRRQSRPPTCPTGTSRSLRAPGSACRFEAGTARRPLASLSRISARCLPFASRVARRRRHCQARRVVPFRLLVTAEAVEVLGWSVLLLVLARRRARRSWSSCTWGQRSACGRRQRLVTRHRYRGRRPGSPHRWLGRGR